MADIKKIKIGNDELDVTKKQDKIDSTHKLSADLVDDSSSTHKFTTAADISKLSGIEAGAEVNVQSDWSQTTTTADDYIKNKPTIGNATLTIQKNSTTIDTFTANATTNKTINIPIPTTAADVSALPASTKYGASISVSVNSTDYKITTTLKDQDGNTLGTAQVVDLPLESVVVSGSFDSTNKKIILTLQNGNTVDIPVGDLVAGLQTEITSENKLDSDLVDDTNQAHKFMTAAERTKLSGIATGAEVNVQSDWNVTDNTSDAFIKNKPIIPSIVDMTGATSSTAGAHGYVPAPAAGDNNKFLRGDGTWQTAGGGNYTAGAHIDITNNVIKAKDYVHSENPVTASQAATISGSQITNGSIDSTKLAQGAVLTLQTTTTDPGEGAALPENTLLGVYNLPHEYKSGELLAASQNTSELSWNGTTCAFWGAGNWTQYGRMKKTTNPAVLQITNPTSKPWIVEFSMSCPTVNIPTNCYIESGLCEISLPTTITKRISQTIVSCNNGSTNIWLSYSNKKLVTIPAGETKNIGSFVRTSSSNNVVWKGGDEISGTSTNLDFGGASCILEAKLIDDGNS